MAVRFSFKPGSTVAWRGKTCSILEAVSASSVLLEITDTKAREVAAVADLRPLKGADADSPSRSLDGLAPEDLAEAKRRFAIIKPLVRCERRRDEDVIRIAEANGVCRTTIYDWIRLYEGRRLMSDLAPRRKGRKMPKRLTPEIEAIITSVIDEHYLSKQKKTGEEVIAEVHRRCRVAKLDNQPCAGSIRARLRAIHPREKMLRREGKKAAHDRFGAVKGHFPGADVPLAVVQIDHTLLDIIVLDEEMRLPIGRPWLTLAIDVFSRMVFGYHLSLDHPSAFAVGLCLCHGMFDKVQELERLGIKGEWPVWGKPRMVHADNGKDFRSYTIQDTLDEYDIRYEFRPPKTPHYGGHIERLAGTLGKKIHALPGATFSNPKQRGEYKSEAKAQMTLRELQHWLVNLIVGVYHNKVHDGIGCPPLSRWNEGIIGNDRFRGIGLPDPIASPRRLRLDFLPFQTRTVQSEGIVWDKIWYRDPLLSQWVKIDEGRRRRKFKVRRDPTDISKLYFLDPALNEYVEIPYRDFSRPSISLWDYRAVEAWLRRQGKAAENEQAIFDAYDEMHRITTEAAKQTKRVRREQAKKREKEKHRNALTLDPPPPAQPDPVPKASRGRDGRLALVVNNTGTATVPATPKWADDFDLDDNEIKKGVEEW
ncbi:MAG: DDE-type integrase/transposase/recombinase [Magnetospirillum sp.]|nr:DDE-type integrase/transposase/recombinase [Magnetospirillum sp.]